MALQIDYNAERLLSVTNKQGTTTLSSFNYTLNAAGMRTQMVDTTGTTTYGYDDLHRLTSVTYPGPQTDTYTYDAVGNRLSKNSTAYTYDDANQLSSVGAVTYGYDANGNQTSRDSDTFEWDHLNRLVEADIGGQAIASAYNGDGLRVEHAVDTSVTEYVWDVGAGLPVILDDGTNKFIYGIGLIATVSGSGTTYRLTDGLGSTANLCDETGAVLVSYTYDAFGAVRSQSAASDNYFLFAGEQRDEESGLDYLRARYYDPATGRFLGPDPAAPDYGSPGTLNPYNYVLANPVNWVDPFGLQLVVVCDVKDANGVCLQAHYKGTLDEIAAEAALLESQGNLNEEQFQNAEVVDSTCALNVPCAAGKVVDAAGQLIEESFEAQGQAALLEAQGYQAVGVAAAEQCGEMLAACAQLAADALFFYECMSSFGAVTAVYAGAVTGPVGGAAAGAAVCGSLTAAYHYNGIP